jgi:hypothetical protein
MVLLGPEGWRALGKDPDAFMCCSGHECGCGGETNREHFEAQREAIPKLIDAWIEVREVGAWHA